MFEYVMTFPCEVKPGSIADVNERIVRCRDCKYQRDCYCDHPKGKYMNAILPVELDSFCSWGEPKEVKQCK